MDRRKQLLAVLPEIEEIIRLDLRSAVIETWLDVLGHAGYVPDDLETMPASMKLLGRGFALAHHIRGVCRVAEATLAAYEAIYPELPVKLDRDTVIAGALLHDVGKPLEINRAGDTWVWSSQSQYVRHASMGVGFARSHGIPDPILGIIAYHIGAELPMPRTAECEVVHLADDLNFKPFFLTPAKIIGTD